MKYFLILLNSIANYDLNTEYENFNAKNYGLDFSYFPLDDFLGYDGKYFCTERLFISIFNQKTSFHDFSSGVRFKQVIRVTKNSNWNSLYPEAATGNWIEVELFGKAFECDFGILKIPIEHEVVKNYVADFLIVSENGVKKLLLNHCPYLAGCEIAPNDISMLNSILGKIIKNRDNFLLLKHFKGDIF
ncbi:MAG: hypothetical protein IPJ64_10435 [Saprospiraceae bacterium]|nr:hypothetical protein [Saprospiraceae bacterium]MBK7796769.1 hypothetical protein [Saprospiraceae bacterium]